MIKVIANTFLNFTILHVLFIFHIHISINEKYPNPVPSNDTFDMTVSVPFLEVQAAMRVVESMPAVYQIQQVLVKTPEKRSSC